MRSIKHQDHVKLRKALAWTYGEKENAGVSDWWQIKVMEHIRNIGPFCARLTYLDLFQRLVWRLAPAACILLIILGMVLSRLDFMTDYVIAKIFMQDPTNYNLLALL
jgi:hypothetical protein